MTGSAVLILAHAFPPENLVGALRPQRFARYLPDFGFPARVITASPQPANGSAADTVSFVPDPGRFQGRMPLSVRLEREIAGRLQLSGGDQSLRWIPAALATSE